MRPRLRLSAVATVLPLRPIDAMATFTLMANVKERRRGATTISSKNQITIPAAELRAAGLEAGERLVARADGPGSCRDEGDRACARVAHGLRGSAMP